MTAVCESSLRGCSHMTLTSPIMLHCDCPLPAVHSSACHCVMQSQPNLLILWYLTAGFAGLPVTYNTYTPTVNCSHTHTHFDACFSLHTVYTVTCSLRVLNSVRLPDNWMLDSLHCLKCNSELCFLFLFHYDNSLAICYRYLLLIWTNKISKDKRLEF